MSKKKVREIPAFESEDEERAFWAEQDSSDLVDWKKAQSVKLTNLKPSTKTISIRFPEFLIADIKMLANKKDIPYQSLIKIYLADRIEKELKAERQT